MSDENLLRRLAASFPVDEKEPDPSSLRQLSVAVATMQRPATPPTRPRPRVRVSRRLSPLVITGTVVGALATGTGISYAVGGPIPAAVRSIARSVGLDNPPPPATTTLLPTTAPPATVSPAVGAARQAESTLHQALSSGHSSPVEISHDTTNLARKLAVVGGDHSTGAVRTSADGRRLMDEACRQLEGSPPSGTGPLAGSSGSDSGSGTGQGTSSGQEPGRVDGGGQTPTGIACAAAAGLGTTPSGPTGGPSSGPSIPTPTTPPGGGGGQFGGSPGPTVPPGTPATSVPSTTPTTLPEGSHTPGDGSSGGSSEGPSVGPSGHDAPSGHDKAPQAGFGGTPPAGVPGAGTPWWPG
jgi:hypothetical protein